MARSRLLMGLFVAVAFCAMAGTSFAATTPKAKCAFNGAYSFFFWDQDDSLSGVGYLSVNCKGQVLPGGIINCN